MSDKKYYWLKLQRDFFKRHDIRIVEEMPNGKDYILFYLKLLLESINHEGRLRFSEEIPYNAEMLAVITNTNIDIVRTAIKIFCDLGMITIYDDQTIYLNEVQKMIGCETEWAQKKRDYRERLAISNNDETAKIEQNEDNVLSMSDKSKSKSKSKSIDINIVEQVLDYLNQQANKAYKSTTEKTRRLIQARVNEGFTIEDFKTVIDTKVYEWGNDPKMEQYLRPETLFGTKFEGYLNQGGKRYGHGSTTVQGNAEAVPKKHNFFE